MAKAKVRSGVRIHLYSVIADAVAEGVAYGYTRAHKHDPKPTEYAIKETIESAVMSALCDVLDFGDYTNG